MVIRAGSAARHMILYLLLHGGIELAIEIGLDQLTGGCACHLGFLPRDLTHSSRRLRARARRDITVPIGIAAISAISRYDNSSSSRMMMISRYSGGSDSMQVRNGAILASATKPASAVTARSEAWVVSSKATAVRVLFCRRRQVRQGVRT